jgi:hypothetical protein
MVPSALSSKKEEREGREKEKAPPHLDLAHRVHKAKGPTVRELMHIHQVHAFFLFDLNLLLNTM